MVEAKPVGTPMAMSAILTTFDSEDFEGPSLYRSTIEALQYLSITRPEILCTINKLSQFMHNPKLTHWLSMNCILRYLKQTIDHGLILHKSTTTQLQAFIDADWAGSRDDRRSTGGLCFLRKEPYFFLEL